jgi:hypothetical protein
LGDSATDINGFVLVLNSMGVLLSCFVCVYIITSRHPSIVENFFDTIVATAAALPHSVSQPTLGCLQSCKEAKQRLVRMNGIPGFQGL